MFRPFLLRAARVAPQQQFTTISGCKPFLSAASSPLSWKPRSFHATALAQAKLNVEQLADKVNLKGQNVLVRVDLNVPLAKVSQ